MRLLGIDYGRKRIGLAISEGLVPSPLSVISIQSQKQALSEIKTLCKKLGIERLVVGIVKGTLEKEILDFAKLLSIQTEIPVTFVDESLTSKSAIRKMIEGQTTKKKRRTMEDATAAALILEEFLEGGGI